MSQTLDNEQKLTKKASKLIKSFTIEIDDIQPRVGEVNTTFEVEEQRDDIPA